MRKLEQRSRKKRGFITCRVCVTLEGFPWSLTTSTVDMTSSGDFGPLRKFKLVFLGEQSGESLIYKLKDDHRLSMTNLISFFQLERHHSSLDSCMIPLTTLIKLRLGSTSFQRPCISKTGQFDCSYGTLQVKNDSAASFQVTYVTRLSQSLSTTLQVSVLVQGFAVSCNE